VSVEATERTATLSVMQATLVLVASSFRGSHWKSSIMRRKVVDAAVLEPLLVTTIMEVLAGYDFLAAAVAAFFFAELCHWVQYQPHCGIS